VTDVVALRLAERIDELSRALARAGVAPDASAQLLELAAVAAMHAVSLDALSAPAPAPSRRLRVAPPPAPRALASVA
jgi:hypothetical protein